MQTQSEENYLKTIYLLNKQSDSKVSITALASALKNNPASVIEMIKRLSEKKLIEYDKTSGVRLTSSGLKSAIQTIRKHRLWEMFLQQKLDYTWDEVHEIAEQLEHVQEESLADRLDKFLGHPEFDPHGEAIPKSNGQLPDTANKTLHEGKIGVNYKVITVKDTSKSFLQYLHRLNISIGTTLKILEKIDFDDSLIILINETDKVTISQKLATGIFVGLV